MSRKPFIACLVSILLLCAGLAPAIAGINLAPTVEFPAAIHFLTPAGDDIEVEFGVNQVEATESWLKLVPEGESPSRALLLEVNRGPHEEKVPEPLVRTIFTPETPEGLHLALLMPDGVGREVVGTVTDIRPRGLNLSFVGRTGKAQT